MIAKKPANTARTRILYISPLKALGVDVERNPNYWNNGKTVINKVTYLPIQSTNAELNRYLAGEVDLTYNMPIERFKQMKKEHPNEVQVSGYVGTYYYQYNFKHKPFDDVRVRRAISHAIDRKAFIDGAQEGLGKPIGSHFAPTDEGYVDLSGSYAYDPEKAKALLTEAGYGPGNPLKLTLLYNTAEIHKKMALAIANLWKQKLGARVELTNQEWKTYLDSRQSGQFEVIRSSWVADYNDPSAFLGLWGSHHSGNMARFANPAYDKLLAQAANSQDPAERARLFDEAETILQDEAPIAPIYQYTNARLIKPWLKASRTPQPGS